MLLNSDIVKKVFLEVINKQKTFEEVSKWASLLIRKDEAGEIEIDSTEDISKIFSALTFLVVLNSIQPSKKYIYSIDDVKNKFDELFNEKI